MDELTFGERSADRLRDVMGSWRFIFFFFVFMAIWIISNAVFGLGGDPFPFILLNLFLSMLAAVQASALLIAARREDAISSEVAVHTVENTDDIKELVQINTDLTNKIKEDTTLLDEIYNILKRKEGNKSE